MKNDDSLAAIPRDIAFQLCQEIREQNRGKWYRWTTWMCWGCQTFCQGDMAKMCVGSRPDGRGCVQVNEGYARRQEAGVP